MTWLQCFSHNGSKGRHVMFVILELIGVRVWVRKWYALTGGAWRWRDAFFSIVHAHFMMPILSYNLAFLYRIKFVLDGLEVDYPLYHTRTCRLRTGWCCRYQRLTFIGWACFFYLRTVFLWTGSWTYQLNVTLLTIPDRYPFIAVSSDMYDSFLIAFCFQAMADTNGVLTEC